MKVLFFFPFSFFFLIFIMSIWKCMIYIIWPILSGYDFFYLFSTFLFLDIIYILSHKIPNRLWRTELLIKELKEGLRIHDRLGAQTLITLALNLYRFELCFTCLIHTKLETHILSKYFHFYLWYKKTWLEGFCLLTLNTLVT